MNLDQKNLIELAQAVKKLVEEAGSQVYSFFGTTTFDIHNKNINHTRNKPIDFVTSVDIHSERYLIAGLKKLVPEASILSEEAGRIINFKNNNTYCWVIDPLDGTTNFIRNTPYFCLSVALTQNGTPVLGVIYDPVNKELFWAIQGHGSHMTVANNGQQRLKIPSQYNKELRISCGGAYQYPEILERIRGHASVEICYFGSAALDLAHVAAGRLDGFVSYGLKWWDVAAGMLLIQEAGGLVTDFDKKPISDKYTTFIGAAPEIYGDLISSLDN